MTGLGDMFARLEAESMAAEAEYERLRASKSLASHQAVAYRCAARKCLLLDVVTTPLGVIVHRPAYRLSPSINAAGSNESGRAKNTTDGDRRWKAHTFPRGQAMDLSLHCDHTPGPILAEQRLDSDIAARRGVVILAPDGTEV